MLSTINNLDPGAAAPALDDPAPLDDRTPLLALLQVLEQHGYRFVTSTPASHARVVARPDRQAAHELRDVLGWSLPFEQSDLTDDSFDLLDAAGVIERRDDGRLAARYRVSSMRNTLFLHSPFPTDAWDSVFLGPDSYRFADLICASMDGMPDAIRILDYGAGAGVGGISAARHHGNAELVLADINPKALRLASINAEHAGIRHHMVQANSPDEVEGPFDLIVTHPPFMMDDDRRAYRHGGDLYGAQLSLDWVMAGVRKLAPGGRLVLHTGVSIVGGRDLLLEALAERLPAAGFRYDYRELDPDIFSEELCKPAYAEVERIAAVGLCVERPAHGEDAAQPLSKETRKP